MKLTQSSSFSFVGLVVSLKLVRVGPTTISETSQAMNYSNPNTNKNMMQTMSSSSIVNIMFLYLYAESFLLQSKIDWLPNYKQRRNDEGFCWNAQWHVFKHTFQGQSAMLLWCKVWFPFPEWKVLVHVSQFFFCKTHVVISGSKTNSNFRRKTNLAGTSTVRICNSASPWRAGWQIHNLQSRTAWKNK